MLLNFIEFGDGPGGVPTLILGLVARIGSLHYPHHLVEEHDVITFDLGFTVLLNLDGFAVGFMLGMELV